MSSRALRAVTISFSILLTMGMMRARVLAATQPASKPLVRGISIHDAPGGAVTIDIALSHSVPYQTLKLTHPHRLVLDLKGAYGANLKGEYGAQSEVLARVRASQWKFDPAVVRIVADLKGDPAYTIKRQPAGIRIEITPTAASGISEAPHTAKADPPDSGKETAIRTAQDGPAPNTLFPVHRFKDLSASLTGPELPPHDGLIRVASPNLKVASPKKADALATVTGISIKPNDKGDTTIDIASSRSVPYRVFQLTNPFRLVIDLRDAHKAITQANYPVESPVLKSVRVSQWRQGNPPVVRVVAELEGYPIFDVHAQQPGIRVELKPREAMATPMRNPFEFTPKPGSIRPARPAAAANQAITAAVNSSAAARERTFSDLMVIGLIQKGKEMQAVISDHGNVFIVPKGETFENNFTVVDISANAVQVHNLKTAQTGWIPYSH
jgi:hypothetical protein